jgi:hypothetical protein
MAAEGLVAGRDVAGADGLVAAAPESESAALVVIVAGSGGWETPVRASWANAGTTVSVQPTPAQTTAAAKPFANSLTLGTRFAILMAIFLPSSGFLSPDVWTVPNRRQLGIASARTSQASA